MNYKLNSIAIGLASLALSFTTPVRADIYIGGHADIGVGFEDGGLHLHLHAEEDLELYGGGTAPAGEYEPGELSIGVPDPSEPRPAGTQWSFLAENEGDPIWFLPQSSDDSKPFIGLGTEELDPADGWTSPVTWTFNGITTLSGEASEFSLYQVSSSGNPVVFASTLAPTASGNSWMQSTFSHDHYNFGFTGEGVYDVQFTVSATNDSLGAFSETGSFRFVTGSAITAVPEPGTALLLAAAIPGVAYRRWRRAQSAAAV